MPISLEQIIAATRVKVAERKRSCDRKQMEKQAEKHIPRGFQHVLRENGERGPAIIAELKKASPSRGLIRAEFDPESLARELESAGAAALSVLTDEEFFQGSLENLRRASMATKLPCLRKDFIVDELQVLEARANRADAILLIVAALTQAELENLAQTAKKYGLDVLCEVHDENELQRAVQAGCRMIGVNNRDLRTLKVDLETAIRLGELMPTEVTRVAESGIRNGTDVAKLRAAGYQAFLIGESLMQVKSPGEALRALIAESGQLISTRVH